MAYSGPDVGSPKSSFLFCPPTTTILFEVNNTEETMVSTGGLIWISCRPLLKMCVAPLYPDSLPYPRAELVTILLLMYTEFMKTLSLQDIMYNLGIRTNTPGSVQFYCCSRSQPGHASEQAKCPYSVLTNCV